MATPRALQAAALLSVLYFLSRLVGLVQNAIINSTLPSSATDAYWAAFALPDFINYLVAGGALSITFIPIFTQLQQTGREREAWRFFSTVATLMGGLLIVLLILAELFARPLVAIARSGFLDRPEVFELTVAMTRVLLPAQWFFYIGGLLVGVLNAYKRFGASGWTGAVYNSVAIVVAIILLQFGAGPIAFAWGILIGAIIGNFLLPLLAARKAPPEQQPQFSFAIDVTSPHVSKYFLNAVPIMIGVSLPVVDQLVVGWFATFLHEGAITHLTTGNRVMIAAQGIVGQAASVAAFPFLAAYVANENWSEFSKFMRDGLRRLLFLTLPLSVLLILLARPIITILFGYGQFNNAMALNETSLAFAFYCVGLFAWTAQQLVARGFYAMQDTFTPTIIGSALTIFFFVPLIYLMVYLSTLGDHMALRLVAGFSAGSTTHAASVFGSMGNSGVLGLAAATSIGASAHLLAMSIALEKRLSRRPYASPLRLEKVAGLALRTICACAVMGGAGVLASIMLAGILPSGKFGALLQIAAVGLVGLVVFAVCAKLFAIPEWNWLTRKFTAKLSRRGR